MHFLVKTNFNGLSRRERTYVVQIKPTKDFGSFAQYTQLLVQPLLRQRDPANTFISNSRVIVLKKENGEELHQGSDKTLYKGIYLSVRDTESVR